MATESHPHNHKILHGAGATLKWTLRVLGLIVVVTIIAVIIALGSAGHKSDQSAAKVTPAKYALIHQGMSTSQVRSVLGKPQTTSNITIDGTTTTYWHYGVLSSKGSYQFGFTNGKLTVKARY